MWGHELQSSKSKLIVLTARILGSTRGEGSEQLLLKTKHLSVGQEIYPTDNHRRSDGYPCDNFPRCNPLLSLYSVWHFRQELLDTSADFISVVK
jgi:hypothetical protein